MEFINLKRIFHIQSYNKLKDELEPRDYDGSFTVWKGKDNDFYYITKNFNIDDVGERFLFEPCDSIETVFQKLPIIMKLEAEYRNEQEKLEKERRELFEKEKREAEIQKSNDKRNNKQTKEK
jgi:hypothetical protein